MNNGSSSGHGQRIEWCGQKLVNRLMDQVSLEWGQGRRDHRKGLSMHNIQSVCG